MYLKADKELAAYAVALTGSRRLAARWLRQKTNGGCRVASRTISRWLQEPEFAAAVAGERIGLAFLRTQRVPQAVREAQMRVRAEELYDQLTAGARAGRVPWHQVLRFWSQTMRYLERREAPSVSQYPQPKLADLYTEAKDFWAELQKEAETADSAGTEPPAPPAEAAPAGDAPPPDGVAAGPAAPPAPAPPTDAEAGVGAVHQPDWLAAIEHWDDATMILSACGRDPLAYVRALERALNEARKELDAEMASRLNLDESIEWRKKQDLLEWVEEKERQRAAEEAAAAAAAEAADGQTPDGPPSPARPQPGPAGAAPDVKKCA